MNTCHLGKDIFTDDRLVGGHGDAAITFHQAADGVELVLTDVRLRLELVFQNNLNTRQRRIAAAFAEAVHRYM